LNTPAHVLLSAFALGRGRWRAHWVAITVGALLPDAPMFGFYAWQRIALRASDGRIWSETYFAPAWQAFFDLFNSLPLIAVAALIAWRLGAAAWVAGLMSMALHCVADLARRGRDDARALRARGAGRVALLGGGDRLSGSSFSARPIGCEL
jgi:hypothetical protein